MKTFDIIVVGAGMVGATQALAAARQGWLVALVDARAPQLEWPAEGYDIRVSALTRASQRLFEELGAWEAMAAERISPYREMVVWDAGGRGHIHFDSAEVGEPDIGHIVENRVIVKGLHMQVAKQANIETFWPARPVAMQRDANSVELTLEDGTTLTGRLLIGTDGGRSWVRETANIPITGWDYNQTAVVTVVRPRQFHRETAWQRFLPTGPLAFLPLTEGYCSIVWSTSPEQAERLLAMEEDRFARELESAFESRLGPIDEVGPRAAFPLRFFETRRYADTRLALAGDAAHTIHPLAGQGVNLGLADVRTLTRLLRDARTRRRDPGGETLLRRYQRERRSENRPMLVAMDTFKELFSNDQPVLAWLRNTGLNITDRMTPVKNRILREVLYAGTGN